MTTAHSLAVGGQKRTSADPVRVIAVDDSPLVRSVFRRLISAESDLALVGTAASAEEALALLATVQADVILLDLEMPGMGGLDAIPQIIASAAPARILVVSSLTVRGAEHTLAALSLGAADTLTKPRTGEFDDHYRQSILRRIRLLGLVAKRARSNGQPQAPALRPLDAPQPKVLAIGASTGGIHAIGQLLRALPPSFTLPILVTQHLPASFSTAFARQLQLASARTAVVGEDRLELLAGRIHIAPGDAHLTLSGTHERPLLRLDRSTSETGCCPSVDQMFTSCARVFGAHTVGVVLSGMGSDGAAGAARIAEAGGAVLAQDAASSAVWGMPGAVANAGIANMVLPPDQIARRVAASLVRR